MLVLQYVYIFLHGNSRTVDANSSFNFLQLKVFLDSYKRQLNTHKLWKLVIIE